MAGSVWGSMFNMENAGKIKIFFCVKNVEKIEMCASMRNAKICAIVSQTHFRNVQDLTEL